MQSVVLNSFVGSVLTLVVLPVTGIHMHLGLIQTNEEQSSITIQFTPDKPAILRLARYNIEAI